MKNKIFFVFLIVIFCAGLAFGDAFVPEFDAMQTIRCDYVETVLDSNNRVVAQNKQFRIFKIDDEYQNIYLQKEPVDNIIYFGDDRIEFRLQSMTDDFIMDSNTVINRTSGEYLSEGQMTYDNPAFDKKIARSEGLCKIVK